MPGEAPEPVEFPITCKFDDWNPHLCDGRRGRLTKRRTWDETEMTRAGSVLLWLLVYHTGLVLRALKPLRLNNGWTASRPGHASSLSARLEASRCLSDKLPNVNHKKTNRLITGSQKVVYFGAYASPRSLITGRVGDISNSQLGNYVCLSTTPFAYLIMRTEAHGQSLRCWPSSVPRNDASSPWSGTPL